MEPRIIDTAAHPPSIDTTINAYSDAEKGTPSDDGVSPLPPVYMKEANKEVTLPSLEKQPKNDSKPPAKPKKKASKWVLWRLWFNTYRKFFTFCFGLNMIGLGLAASGHFPYAIKYSGAMVVANFNFAILMRNEVFGRILYWFVNTCFAKIGLHVSSSGKDAILRPFLLSDDDFKHLGGIHSGCALSGVLWLLFKVITMFRTLDVQHDAVLIMGVVTNLAVMISALSAFPWVRNNHHNRLYDCKTSTAGYTGAFVILGDTYDGVTRTWNLDGVHIVQQQDFWFTIGMTTFVALPWFFVREVSVEVELSESHNNPKPSPKVAILRFERGMQQGLLGRISRSSIMEYHAFGIISEGKDAKHHYMICGVQGDFTRSLVNDPPKTIWTRELKFAGVSNTSTLYKRGIRVLDMDRLRPGKDIRTYNQRIDTQTPRA
ncbi:hypothetical protein WG66_007170 [Moniliophthora roreri]|nr:hypothetical protein WG66_007170 [Moniliophthora roreri]